MIELTNRYRKTIYIDPSKIVYISPHGYGGQYTNITLDGGEVLRVKNRISRVRDKIYSAEKPQNRL